MNVSAEPIDELVSELVVARLSQPDVADLIAPSPAFDIGALRTEANALRVRLDEAAQLFADGSINAAQLTRINTDVNERLDVVNAELAEAGKGEALGQFIGVDDTRERWEALHVTTKREIIKSLFSKIVLVPPGRGSRAFNPDNVQVEWRQ